MFRRRNGSRTGLGSTGLFVVFVVAAVGTSDGRLEPQPRSVVATQLDGLSPYRGLATWVDIYDHSPYRRPRSSVRKMAENGVQTLFLETANYRIRKRIFRPVAVARLIEAAHAKGMQVVAWYLPSFSALKKDFRRATAAIRFRTPDGQGFDSFALDIEATNVSDIDTRNARARRLATRIRNAVGARYTLGAIVPEASALYWPNFPYRVMARRFDVFIPMAYFTFRTQGYDGVYRFISKNIRAIRRETSDPSIPIHVIGGLSDDATTHEVRAFVAASNRGDVTGASLYSFPTTTSRQWEVLGSVKR